MYAYALYQQWLESPHLSDLMKEELRAIEGLSAEIEDRFHKRLEFGTGGMRGILGAGTNRINVWIIRMATQGLAEYMTSLGEDSKQKGVVIAYDSRRQSREFALETACTLAGNGIKAYLFESLRPTPELSFAVRELGTQAGVVITASHNPPEYNGYKVYGADGGQIVSDVAQEIVACINKVENFSDIVTLSQTDAEQSGYLTWVGQEIDDLYVEKLKELCLNRIAVEEKGSSLKIVYTPLHGAGGTLIPRVLCEAGFQQVYVVPEQEVPDPDFPTVKQPNPEEREAFDLAVCYARQIDADLIVGTDPDVDRAGVLVRQANGDYEILTGNQTGALLLHYLLSQKQQRGELPAGATMIKTIVTSEMGREIAQRFGVDTMETLTGFKYIAEQIRLFEEKQDRTFVFGYEESYGYLAGTFVRDKDAVMATLFICEMAAYYSQKGMTLSDALEELYAEFGFFQEELLSRTLKGIEGMKQINRIMQVCRENPPLQVGDRKVTEYRDYLTDKSVYAVFEEGKLELPKENVLHFTLDDCSWFCLRPSGTEPKIKIYMAVRGNRREEASSKMRALKAALSSFIDQCVLGVKSPTLV